ncbi:MAG TPA: hypothetical protein VGR35_10735 [Tepidisphaeraceae bacterium]|nr:hypothetical protein [Tepidisphaeraceae bacterium]
MDLEKLLKDMLAAMEKSLKPQWKGAKGFASGEAKKLAHTLVDIGTMRAAGEITEDQARLLLDMQKAAARAVLLAVEGIGVVAAEQAMAAALGVVAAPVNKALGFNLLSVGATT